MEPAATLAPDGSLSVIYMKNRPLGAANELRVARIEPGGKVAHTTPLRTDRSNYFNAWMATDRAGGQYGVFLAVDFADGASKRSNIQLVRSHDGSSFGPPVTAADLEQDCPTDAPDCLDKPMVAVGPDRTDPSRDAVYTFYATPVGVRVTRSTDGGRTFSSSTDVGPSAYADAHVTPDGVVHVVMVVGGGDPLGSDARRTVYLRSTDGARTFESTVVSPPGESVPYFFSNPHLAIDPSGVLSVVYPAGTADGVWDIFLATSSDGGTSWSHVKVNDDPSCASHILPMAEVDPLTGTVHVAWNENRDGRGALAYTTCARGGGSCAPNERISDVPFAAYSLVRHSSIWMGQYNALVLDAEHRRLHAVWTQPVDEGGKPKSRVFYAQRPL